jgi:TonB family protein
MVKKVILFSTLFIIIASSGIAYSQTESGTNKNDSILHCNACDSLYNRICPPEIFGDYMEVPPVFPGGYKTLFDFLIKNLQYPAECIDMDIQGRVIVRFIVSETGEIICPKIQRSLHPAMDEEALRVIGLMPNWIPASNGGVPFKMCYTLPVLFKLNTIDEDTNDRQSFFKRILWKLLGK